MKKNPKHNIKRTVLPKSKFKFFELILRGLPFDPPMSVGVKISPIDLALLQKNGRILVDIDPKSEETKNFIKSIKKA